MKRKRNLLKEIIIDLSFNENKLISVSFWASVIIGFIIAAVIPETKWAIHVEVDGPEQLKWLIRGIGGASLGMITFILVSTVICFVVHVVNEIRYLISK